jgi:hypothetical protein
VGCSDSRCETGGNTCTDIPVGGGTDYCCGDLTCEGLEDGFNCEVDCGAAAFCGDDNCDPGEDICSCPADCGSPPANESTCNDGIDDDCDGATDCDDTDCGADPSCAVTCLDSGAACNSDDECCSGRCKNNTNVCK